MQLGTLPEEVAGDLSGVVSFLSLSAGWSCSSRHPLFYWYAGFSCFFALYMMISYLGIGLRGRDFDYPRHQERVAAGSIQTTCGYISSNLW
jgi:hypothetical protein